MTTFNPICSGEAVDENAMNGGFQLIRSGKRPLRQDDLWSHEDLDSGEEDAEYPDLRVYFSRYALDDEDVMSLCRSYATYLSSKLRNKKKLKK